MQGEMQMPLAQLLVDIALGGPHAAVVAIHVAGTVVAFGNIAFEIRVGQRMVFHLHRQALYRRIEAGFLRHRPALQHAVDLQAEVVVQPPRRVLLHHEDAAAGLGARRGRRLGGVPEVALASIFLKFHGGTGRRRRRAGSGASLVLRP